MYCETDLIPLSALQHYLYCPRQCALIHLEQAWTENRYTAEGRILHERADSGRAELRNGVRTVRSLWLRSLRLGLTGKADVVEFHYATNVAQPYPVEYKRGRPKKDNPDAVQLCAQAMCLEEMLGLSVPEGALYYGKQKRRTIVLFTDALRQRVADTAHAVHAMIVERRTPPPVADKRCRACSLIAECMPQNTLSKVRASRYLANLITSS